MAEAKPFASLSSGLLARKGQAKPAMRRQGYEGFSALSVGGEDLGWNDMGLEMPHPAGIEMPPIADDFVALNVPQVIRQREELAEELGVEADPVVKPTPVVTLRPVPIDKARAPKRQALQAPLTATGRKAAFTLRLDSDRHLKLRLACAVSNRSAQLLVTEALDAFLKTIPEIDDLADRVPARTAG